MFGKISGESDVDVAVSMPARGTRSDLNEFTSIQMHMGGLERFRQPKLPFRQR